MENARASWSVGLGSRAEFVSLSRVPLDMNLAISSLLFQPLPDEGLV